MVGRRRYDDSPRSRARSPLRSPRGSRSPPRTSPPRGSPPRRIRGSRSPPHSPPPREKFPSLRSSRGSSPGRYKRRAREPPIRTFTNREPHLPSTTTRPVPIDRSRVEIIFTNFSGIKINFFFHDKSDLPNACPSVLYRRRNASQRRRIFNR